MKIMDNFQILDRQNAWFVPNNDYYNQPLLPLIQLSVSQKGEKSDSFVEKLSMQIVKNLQVCVLVAECCDLSWQLHMFVSL